MKTKSELKFPFYGLTPIVKIVVLDQNCRVFGHDIIKGGEASSWDYGQKLKKHLKQFFAKFQFSTVYGGF